MSLAFTVQAEEYNAPCAASYFHMNGEAIRMILAGFLSLTEPLDFPPAYLLSISKLPSLFRLRLLTPDQIRSSWESCKA